MTTTLKLRSGSYISANYRLLDGSMHFASLIEIFSQAEFKKFPTVWAGINKPCLICGQRTNYMLFVSSSSPDHGLRCTDCVDLTTATKTTYRAYN